MARFIFVFVALSVLRPPQVRANNGIVTEAVSNYGGNNLPNAIPNASGFRTGMTGWSVKAAWTDSSVWDSDFVDPELPNGAGGDDTLNFDASNVAISYFCGHGTCDAGFPGGCLGSNVQVCAHASTCSASANPWGTGAGVCRYWPGGSTGPGNGYCAYATPRFLVTNSTADMFGHWINYSDSSNNYVGWGESASSGAWRGAGQNGNTNLVVLDLSNGVEPSFVWQNLSSAFAGAHMIATLMPTAGDTAMVADRGSAFAASWQANPSGSVGSAWLNAMNALPGEGGACGANGVTNGGYKGFNGCGCNFFMTVGATNAEAISHVNETWSQMQDDSRDAKGKNYYYYYYMCNYDTTVYPIALQ